MKPTFILPLLAALAFQGCTTPTEKQRIGKTFGTAAPISLDELESMTNRKPLRANKVRVTFEKLPDGDGIRAVPIDVKIGQRALIEASFEVRYPTKFALPQTNAKVGSMTPTTPSDFVTQNTGTTIEFTPVLRGAFVILTGTVTERKLGGFTQNPGFHPVTSKDGTVISVNRCVSPMFTTWETAFFAALQPGKTESFMVNSEHGPKRITFSCAVF